MSEAFVSSAETAETVGDFRSLLQEYVEQRTEALKRIEELAQKNLRRLTGDVLAICDAVLAGLPTSLKTRQLFAMGLAVREVQGQSVYKRQVAEEVKTVIDEGNGDEMESNTVLTG